MAKILLDPQGYATKPTGNEIACISKRIVKNIYESRNLRGIADLIGSRGHTWCPAIFEEKRRIDNFKEVQLIALDFDGTVGFDDVNNRAKEYMIPILFAYETFSSISLNKFRVVFMMDKIIYDKEEFDMIINMLMRIFEGCDTACKDISRMFFGGKNLFYYNSGELTLNMNTLKMNFEKFMKDKYNGTHYQDKLKKFYGKISPNPTVNSKRGNGEKLPKHRLYRSDILNKLSTTCQLYDKFISDSEWLYYPELFGIATNLINVEGGSSKFRMTVENSKYDTYKKDWKFYLSYMKNNNYAPMSCDKFCPYANFCPHNSNMMSTAKIKRHDILRIRQPEYTPIDEVYDDLKTKFYEAVNTDDKRIHLIKAQTAIGKTQLYIEYLSQTKTPCIIAVPTNLLKQDVYNRCIEAGIDIRMTPSVEDIKNDIPQKVYAHIQKLYDKGNHKDVYRYIGKKIKFDNIPALERFMRDKQDLKNYKGHIITTHHRILYSKKEWLSQYQIIIDEDIMKTIVQNTYTVNISDIEDIIDNGAPKKVYMKLDKIIDVSEDKKYFSIDKVKLKSNIDASFDIKALLKAEKYYSDGDTVTFYKTPKLKKLKYIVLSATADDYIYKHYFGKDRVQFYRCKQAKYMGHLKQYYSDSYSRNYIDKNDNVFDRVRHITGDITTITFKKYSSDCDIHFGNSEGCNTYAGENLAVIGTPHMNESVYKLLSYHMDGNVSEMAHFRPVEYNGCRFWFYTYEDELLKRIQFWLIRSELEQCVGRARLLRNDCTVYLFSNFPLEASELVK